MNYRVFAVVGVLLASGVASGAQGLPDRAGRTSSALPPALQNVGFEPPLDGQIPLDLPFRDESSQAVHLRDYFGPQPVLLALVYYGCPMLCNEVQQGVVGSLKMLTLNPGRDYQVLFVSFDSRETPEMAARKKKSALAHFGRPETFSGWHFLTGSQASVDALSRAVNFRYSFNSKTNLFAHASGILLLTPAGRISRYFYGVEYPSRDVRLGLVDASAGRIGSPIDHLLLYCFAYDPTTARYSASILKVVRAGGVLTILSIVAAIVMFRRRDARASAPSLRDGPVEGAP